MDLYIFIYANCDICIHIYEHTHPWTHTSMDTYSWKDDHMSERILKCVHLQTEIFTYIHEQRYTAKYPYTHTRTHNNNIHLQKFLRFHHLIQNRPTHPVVCLHTARTFLLRFPVMLHPCKLTSQSTNPNAHRLYPLLLPVIGGRRYGVFEI